MREYRLKSPGQPGGLLPLGAPSLPPEHPPEHALTPATATPAPAPDPAAVPVPRFAAGLPAMVPPAADRPAPAPRQPRSATAPVPRKPSGGPLLSLKQKAKIGSAAARAYQVHLTADPDWLPDMLAIPGNKKSSLAENWRHSQVALATRTHPAGQVAGLSHARNAHYNTLLAHFCALAGLDSESFTATMRDRTDPATGENADDFRQGKYLLEQAMQATGISWAYVMAIVKRKHHTTRLEDLTRQQLINLRDTVNNRSRSQKYARNEWHPRDIPTGPEGRNKKQRAASPQTAPIPAPAPDNIVEVCDGGRKTSESKQDANRHSQH